MCVKSGFFLKRFRDPIWVPKNENWFSRIREDYVMSVTECKTHHFKLVKSFSGSYRSILSIKHFPLKKPVLGTC